jgi:hypothetical protein
VEESDGYGAKLDAIMAMLSKQPNLDNVPLQELVANNVEGVDVNYIKISATMLMGITTIVGILDHLLGITLMVVGHPLCPTTLILVDQ